MTLIDIPALTDERIDACVERAIGRVCADRDRWDRADFASEAALALLQMRPPTDAGEKAEGISEGLEMAARTILRLAGIPTDTQEAARG